MKLPNSDKVIISRKKLTEYVLSETHYNILNMKELDIIILNRNIIKHNLKKGDLGSIVHIYDDGKTFEVEFITTKGKTMAVLTLNQADIRPMIRDEILHVRGFASI